MNVPDNVVKIRILFFAGARDIVGQREAIDRVPGQIAGRTLLEYITENYKLDRLKCNFILAHNEDWIDLNSDLNLKEDDEIAVIPPLSGVARMNWVKLTNDKLSVEAIYDLVCSSEFGAVSMFVGTTRDHFEGKTVAKLEYEAYEQMAVKSLEKICQSIRDQFDVGNIAIFHRLGTVPIKEASVVIAISSTHRAAGLKAVPYAIDALKGDVPIWKKEVYEDGQSSVWKENAECSDPIPVSTADSINLYEEVVKTDDGGEVASHLIQVKANQEEINRRINSFINRKREQINISNRQNFCLDPVDNSDEPTCARVSAYLKRRKDSKSHLKVHRVENITGPQTNASDSYSMDFPNQVPSGFERSWACPPGAEERLTNVENYLSVSERTTNVFSRLKAVEDRILYLESISPEYFDFDRSRGQHPNVARMKSFSTFKRTYSSSELDIKLHELEAKLQKKI